jgi:two-component sensor histidine kinase
VKIIKDKNKNIAEKGKSDFQSERLLLHVVDGINRTLELKEVLRKCMEAAKVVMNAEASSLMLLDEQTGNLNVSIPTGPVKDKIMGTSVPKSKGIGGWVISYNQPFISNDVVESDVFWKDLSNGFTTRNIICVPLQDGNGDAFGVLQAINKNDGETFGNKDVIFFESLATHVSSAIERSKKFDELERKVQERDTQLMEIHHRLKNNLSMICGLLEFDLIDVKEKSYRHLLSTVSSRLRSVAEAHSLLYDQRNSDTLDLSQYLTAIIRNVENIFETSDKDIRLNIRFEEINLNPNQSMICGLILNELLINAYKHAFVNQDSGEVVVSLKQTSKDKVVLIVNDNGNGMDAEMLKSKKSGINAKFIINSLVDKIGGDITYTNNVEVGSTCILSFRV